jgi:MSHA biogenesis protein MshL
VNKPVTYLVALYVLLSTGCANMGASMGPFLAKNTDSSDEAIALLREGEQYSESARSLNTPNVSAEVAPASASESNAVPEQVEHRFDLQVDEAQAAEFFRSLVVDTAYNMVVHPDVKGTVSLVLNDVTIFDVMQVMRDVYSYDFVLRGNVFQVYPDVLRTEIYNVNYLNVSRSGRSETQVSAGKVSDTQGSNSSNGNDGSGNNGTGDNQGNNRGSSQVVGTIVNTSAEANLWAELAITLEKIVELDQGSSVVVTPQVGLVVVKAKPQTLHAVEDYLSRVDSALSRQVVLEAKIIEVTLKEGFQAGIDWHSFGDASGGTFNPTTFVFEDGSTTTTAGSEHSVAGEFISGANDIFNPLGAAFSLSTAFGDFDATIELLQTQGSVQVLSSPRIATVNNQKAVIKVGSDEFFVTDISSNTVTAGSAINTSESPELTPFFSGIALDVTPQISATNEVILHVHPTVSEVTEQLKNIGGQLVPLAASTIRESDSIVKASSGQIIVIGGLMQNSSSDVNAGVPWLSQIPLIGNLFKQKNQNSVKSELIILLKPMVIEGGSQSQMLSESAGRAEALRQQMRRRG